MHHRQRIFGNRIKYVKVIFPLFGETEGSKSLLNLVDESSVDEICDVSLCPTTKKSEFQLIWTIRHSSLEEVTCDSSDQFDSWVVPESFFQNRRGLSLELEEPCWFLWKNCAINWLCLLFQNIMTDVTGLMVHLCIEDSCYQRICVWEVVGWRVGQGWEASCLGLRLCGLALGLVCFNSYKCPDALWLCAINQWNNNYTHTGLYHIALNITFYFLK